MAVGLVQSLRRKLIAELAEEVHKAENTSMPSKVMRALTIVAQPVTFVDESVDELLTARGPAAGARGHHSRC